MSQHARARPASFLRCLGTQADVCCHAGLALIVGSVPLQQVQNKFAQHGSVPALHIPFQVLAL